MQKQNNKILLILAGILTLVIVIWIGVLTRNSLKEYRYIGQSAEQKHSIYMNGEGKITAVPDIAKIQLGHSVEKKKVADAQKENTEKMNAVIKKLKEEFNIEAKDIQTANYNIYPQYNWTDGRQVLRGYEVSQNISVKIRDLDNISNILDIAGAEGLNQVGGLSFEVDDPQELKQQARELAIKHAKEKAESLAKVAGVKLGNIISFSEYSTEPQYSTNNFLAKEAYGLGGGDSSPDVEVGSTEVIVTATVEYEIY